MDSMNKIIEWLNNTTDYFYDIYLKVLGWPWPLWEAADLFLSLTAATSWLAWYFSDLFSWLLTKADEIAEILDWDTIWDYILTVVPNLEDIRDWWSNWWDNILVNLGTWWDSRLEDVQGFIADAKETLQLLIDELSTSYQQVFTAWDDFKGRIPTLDEVIAWWSNWTGNVLTIVSTWWDSRLLEVQGLIDSAFTARDSLWAGWQDMKDQVIEFFSDPEDQVLKILERALERFW